jgi:uncharacterized repeat protein (TIGR03803 family)
MIDGALYGSTLSGGAHGHGALFKIEASGAFTSLHSFTGADGSGPWETLVPGSDGALYGATFSGGASGFGTVFRTTTEGSFTSLHSFTGSDGRAPRGLAPGGDGAIYGVTEKGGAAGVGTVFRIRTSGEFTSLHQFAGSDGSYPNGLATGSDGVLYGSTRAGGAVGDGALFKVGTNGVFAFLDSFDRSVDGENPGVPRIGPDQALYGVARVGGPGGVGAVYRREPGLDQAISFGALPDRTCADPPFQISATASSGLPVDFTASGVCSVALDWVTITGAGSCEITANQIGDVGYRPAAQAPQSFAIAVVSACDQDGDGIFDGVDNCPDAANPDQADLDQDGIGNACDGDLDGDTQDNGSDNCPFVFNPTQADGGGVVTYDADGIGDACQCGDVSDDGVVDGDDAYAYRGSLADPLGSGLSPAGTAKCAVIAGAGGCSIVNVTVLLRAFESVEPPIEQACAAAGPN